MNTTRLAPFYDQVINGISSNGFYAVQVSTGEVMATIAIECDDHISPTGEDANNFGFVQLHDFSDFKLTDLKFSKYANDTAKHVPGLNSVCINLDAANQVWCYSDEEEYDGEVKPRLVQIVQGHGTQQIYL